MESDEVGGSVCPLCLGSEVRHLGCSGCGVVFIPCECCGVAEGKDRSRRLFVVQLGIVMPVALAILAIWLAI